LSKDNTIPEKIAESKIFVYKPRISIKSVRAISEKMKTQLFRKFVFMKAKSEEVQVISINKYFDPYVVVDGEYIIEYSKNWIHNIQVDETMQELELFGDKIRAISLKGNLGVPCKILQLKGKGRFKRKTKAHIVFNKQWREVEPERLPFVPFEEKPEKILSNIDQKLGNCEIFTEKGVEILKSRIVQRPSEILFVHDELFKISERAIIYKPMYKVTFRNVKTKKEVTMVIDAINGKTISAIQSHSTTQKKKKVKSSTKKSPAAKNCEEQDSSPENKKEDKIKFRLKI
jgi:hypothetical protein